MCVRLGDPDDECFDNEQYVIGRIYGLLINGVCFGNIFWVSGLRRYCIIRYHMWILIPTKALRHLHLMICGASITFGTNNFLVSHRCNQCARVYVSRSAAQWTHTSFGPVLPEHRLIMMFALALGSEVFVPLSCNIHIINMIHTLRLRRNW